MKILYVIEQPAAKGGLERILTDKLNALSEDDRFDVTLLTVWNAAAPVYPLSPKVGRVCLSVPRPSSSLGMMAALPCVLHRYNSEVRRISPDVVVCFRAIGALLAVCSFRRGKCVFESHLARCYCNHRWLYPLMERRVDAVVCLTRGDALNYKAVARVEVIPNFTPIPFLRPSDVHRGHRRCVFVGRLSPEKDPMRLLRLWQKIVARMPGWTLDIYGCGELEGRVNEAVRSSMLSESVRLHGFTTDVSGVYARADMLLLTSRTEGLPMVIIEAMRCGVPVVSTDCPYGPSDLVQHGRTGMLVPPGDDEAYTDAVCRLMQDTRLRETMGREAVEYSRRYCEAEIMSRWKHFFIEL